MNAGRTSLSIPLLALALAWTWAFFMLGLLSIAAGISGGLGRTVAGLSIPALTDLTSIVGEAMLYAIALGCLVCAFVFSWSAASAACGDRPTAGTLARLGTMLGAGVAVLTLAFAASTQPNRIVPVAGCLLLCLALTSLLLAVEREMRDQARHEAGAAARRVARKAAWLSRPRGNETTDGQGREAA